MDFGVTHFVRDKIMFQTIMIAGVFRQAIMSFYCINCIRHVMYEDLN